MTRILLAGVLALVLAGCAGQNEALKVQVVDIPVPVDCVPILPPKPDFADTADKITAAPNVYERGRLMAIGRLQHYAWESVMEAALSACGQPAPAAAS